MCKNVTKILLAIMCKENSTYTKIIAFVAAYSYEKHKFGKNNQ